MTPTDYTLGIINIETSSAVKANRRTEKMKDCPHLLASSLTESTITSVFLVPREKRWWLQYDKLFPGKNASVTIIDRVVKPSHPPRGTPANSLPCGAECGDCPFRQKFDCKGCPVTINK
ncbi:MAG: hypothetical protein GWO20_15190 [Candidatus Korarchaeota archaeon]|nr:hypothetical protein [Candidatus Korarchaeota archaeon]NIU84764.1 hypothetical protein [Candidatus Thorarchaeota archaeon]NIW14397.1 hypothetical protein [Candidatus Thorarchaeota archaeon]NIW52838.1 hypothetical protein [Candidatus Korarchaeota archaeon]